MVLALLVIHLTFPSVVTKSVALHLHDNPSGGHVIVCDMFLVLVTLDRHATAMAWTDDVLHFALRVMQCSVGHLKHCEAALVGTRDDGSAYPEVFVEVPAVWSHETSRSRTRNLHPTALGVMAENFVNSSNPIARCGLKVLLFQSLLQAMHKRRFRPRYHERSICELLGEHGDCHIREDECRCECLQLLSTRSVEYFRAVCGQLWSQLTPYAELSDNTLQGTVARQGFVVGFRKATDRALGAIVVLLYDAFATEGVTFGTAAGRVVHHPEAEHTDAVTKFRRKVVGVDPMSTWRQRHSHRHVYCRDAIGTMKTVSEVFFRGRMGREGISNY